MRFKLGFLLLTIVFSNLAAPAFSVKAASLSPTVSTTLLKKKSSSSYHPLTAHITLHLTITNGKMDKTVLVKDYLASTRLSHDQVASYYPYGGERLNSSDLETDKLFTNHRKLSGISTYQIGARFYSSSLGIFVQPDTVQGDKYVYAANNPVTNSDPTGNICEGVDGSTCRQAIANWLMWNAGLAYGYASEKPLAAKLAQHFLYGHGNPIDISTEYEQALFEIYTSSTGDYSLLTDQQRMARINSQLAAAFAPQLWEMTPDGPVQISSVADARYDVEVLYPPTVTNLATEQLANFSECQQVNISVVASHPSEDLHYALNRHTVSVHGSLYQVANKQSSGLPVWQLSIADPQVSIYDSYDWHEDRSDSRVSTSLSGIFAKRGLNPPPWFMLLFGGIYNYELGMNHHQVGLLLSNPGVGLANTFDVNGRINVGNDLTIILPQEAVPPRPTAPETAPGLAFPGSANRSNRPAALIY